ncbi:Dynactin subunit 5 [Trachymyrmex zeteki]|uniref:Dynactin subunit 5 n=1 Tax=Mycetomoellerius zeteki TaxID=64791 RepID=A0A151X2F8_9HYME|nr:Dynactin subunit 5 [Trachymyrmex zeteki]
MESQDIYYNKAEYVETASKNEVSRLNVRTGCYCIISKNAVIRSPFKKFSRDLTMENHVFVGRRSVLKDCCYIEESLVVPPETITVFTRFAGSPATCVEDLPECTLDLVVDFTKNYYEHFLPASVYSYMYNSIQLKDLFFLNQCSDLVAHFGRFSAWFDI